MAKRETTWVRCRTKGAMDLQRRVDAGSEGTVWSAKFGHLPSSVPRHVVWRIPRRLWDGDLRGWRQLPRPVVARFTSWLRYTA
ncbi:hypothetical protein GCK32_017776 [Trichostrongylus colubriformis]|uniref:Uncharacterized protein n=1 Tax=Trichostrongylus colubriformis TaxID=6319 RepID=A0AAN8FR51_TRICO